MAMMLRQAESYRSELRSGFGRRVLRHSAVAIGPGVFQGACALMQGWMQGIATLGQFYMCPESLD